MEGYDLSKMRKEIDNDDPFPDRKEAREAIVRMTDNLEKEENEQPARGRLKTSSKVPRMPSFQHQTSEVINNAR